MDTNTHSNETIVETTAPGAAPAASTAAPAPAAEVKETSAFKDAHAKVSAFLASTAPKTQVIGMWAISILFAMAAYRGYPFFLIAAPAASPVALLTVAARTSCR